MGVGLIWTAAGTYYFAVCRSSYRRLSFFFAIFRCKIISFGLSGRASGFGLSVGPGSGRENRKVRRAGPGFGPTETHRAFFRPARSPARPEKCPDIGSGAPVVVLPLLPPKQRNVCPGGSTPLDFSARGCTNVLFHSFRFV